MLEGVAVDTLYLVAKLSNLEMQEVKNNIDFENLNVLWHGNKVWRYMIYNKEPFYMIYFEPHVGTGLWTSQHYNIMIYMQREAIEAKPAVLQLLMNIVDWRVKRIDIAYNWLTPLNQTYTLTKATMKKERFEENSNYYLYGRRNPLRVLVYDKKQQLLEKKKQEISEEHLTRLEVRLRPSLKEQSFTKSGMLWIKPYLDRVTFVVDRPALSRAFKTEKDKKAFRQTHRNVKAPWKDIDNTTKRRIRKVTKEHAVDLYALFQEYKLEDNIIWKDETV